MKKIIYNEYGNVNVLKLIETSVPDVGSNEILVRVKAVSVNPLDWKIRNGEMKLMTGKKFPKGVGIDFSGIVEEVGSELSRFKKGDEVFGAVDPFKGGALAEYIIVSEDELSLKSDQISFSLAAVLPVAGTAALQIFENLIQIKKGTEIIINGASGGIGMFAIQLAKMQGAIVTAVVREHGQTLVKGWGADVVIDYQSVDILELSHKFDAVLDLSGQLPYSKAKMIMKSRSVYVNTVPGPLDIIGSFFINLFAMKKFKVLLLKRDARHLRTLQDHVLAGMKIHISETNSWPAFIEGYKNAEQNSILGKLVFTVRP